MIGRRPVANDTRARQRAYRRGLLAEHLAACLLMAKGFRILARRFRCPAGEVDIIARRGRLVVFVEVKRRAADVEVLAALSPRQQARIVRAASYWLSRNPRNSRLDCRFDLVVVQPYLLPRHVQNAFAVDTGSQW